MNFIKILNSFQIIFLKLSSLLIMVLIFLFLWLKMGFSGIGEFATYSALLAPIVMFSQFRYVEYINSGLSKKDKLDRFFEALISSQITFSILFFFLILILILIRKPILIIFVAGLYKVFELFCDLYVAYLISLNEIKKAFFVVIIRLLAVFLGLIFLFNLNNRVADLILILYSLLFLVYFLFFIFDSIGFFRFKLNKDIEVINYIKNNFLYGVNSLLISFNSLAPRYFFIYFGDSKGLGIFTVVYLVASTSTIIIQFLISSKVLLIEKYINKKPGNYFLLNIVLILFCIFLYVASTSIIGNNNIYLFIMFYLVMFVSLVVRGLNLTAAVSKDMKYMMNFSLIFPIIFTSFVLTFVCYYIGFFNFYLAVLYVLVSSVITSLIILYFIKRKSELC